MAFVHSVAKPPRDVRRRQEKFGTGGAAVPEKIRYHLCCSGFCKLKEEGPQAFIHPEKAAQAICFGGKAWQCRVGSGDPASLTAVQAA